MKSTAIVFLHQFRYLFVSFDSKGTLRKERLPSRITTRICKGTRQFLRRALRTFVLENRSFVIRKTCIPGFQACILSLSLTVVIMHFVI